MALNVDRKVAIRSGFWSLIEAGGLSVLSFLTLVAFSRLLSPADLGVFAVSLGVLEMLGLASNMIFHDALVQRAHLDDAHFNTAFTLSIGIATAICAGCWVVAPAFSSLVHDDRAGLVLATMSVGLLLAGPAGTVAAERKRGFGFRLLASRSLIGRGAGALLGVAAAAAGFGFWSLVVQYLAMQLLGSGILLLSEGRRPRLRMTAAVARELIGFGLPAISAQFTGFAIKRVLMLTAGVTLGTTATGYLNLAMRLVDTFWAIAATAAGQVALPTLSALRDHPLRRRAAFLSAVRMSSWLFFPAFAGMALVSAPLVEILFGARWLPAAPLASIIALIILLQAARLFAVPMLTALGRPRDLLKINAVVFACLCAAIIFIQLSTVGRVLAVLAGTELVFAVLFAFTLARHADLGPAAVFACQWRPLIAVLGMSAVIVALDAASLPPLPALARLSLQATAGAISFIAVLFVIDARFRGELRAIGDRHRAGTAEGLTTW